MYMMIDMILTRLLLDTYHIVAGCVVVVMIVHTEMNMENVEKSHCIYKKTEPYIIPEVIKPTLPMSLITY